MYYKLMNNDVVVDLLKKLYYVRYLPKSKRWVGTDALSAHGVVSSDGGVIYHLHGRSHVCPDDIQSVALVEIDAQEYEKLALQSAMQRKETQELHAEIDALKAQLNAQNNLLEQILAKL